MKKTLLFIAVLLGLAGTAKAQVEWTIWEGNMNASYDTGTNAVVNGEWKQSLYLESSSFKDLIVGDVITLSLTKNGGVEGNAQIAFYKQTYNGSNYTESEFGGDIATFNDVNGDYSINISSSTLDVFQADNFSKIRFAGRDYTLTKVTITRTLGSYIKTELQKDATQSGNFNGNLIANAVAGDYLYVEVNNTGTYQLSGSGTENNTKTYTVYDKLLIPLTANQVTNYKATYPWSSITGSITSYSVYLIHPVPTFSIGSIRYATFSANQQVTAPNTVTAYKATVNDNSVTLTPFTNNVIPANTGAIIAGDEGAVIEFVASSESTDETSDLQAMTTATDVTTLESGYDYYVLYSRSQDALALSDLVGAWGNWHSADVSWNNSTHTLTYNGTASGEGGWVGTDWSDYSALKLTFSSNTMPADVTFYVAYSENTDATTEGTLGVGKTTVTIPLNTSYKNAIGNFSCWSSATTAGAFTIESATLIKNTPVAEFRRTTTGTLKANKAYLKIATSSNPAPALSVVFGDDETTSIATPKTTVTTDDRIYNLSGQEVKELQRGNIYIRNGKKFIVK